MDDSKCSKCGKSMIVEKRQLLQVVPGTLMKSSKALFRVTMICPQRQGFLGAFKNNHDQKTVEERQDEAIDIFAV